MIQLYKVVSVVRNPTINHEGSLKLEISQIALFLSISALPLEGDLQI